MKEQQYDIWLCLLKKREEHSDAERREEEVVSTVVQDSVVKGWGGGDGVDGAKWAKIEKVGGID